MNGKHEVRLERIEKSLEELHEKMDAMVETGAVNEADIVWLKWGLRLLFASVVGLGGATFSGLM